MKEKDETHLEHFIYTLPYFNSLSINKDVGVTVTDLEKILLYIPAKNLDMRARAGDPIPPGSAMAQAIKEKRRVVRRGDKTLFGMPYIAACCPIFNETGAVIGGISVAESIDCHRRDIIDP
ncbi:hypothetical protein [Sporomusa termitida]|uniref:Sensory transducer protein YfmS n=1 Tax=Sporomusa termitida TaxID=2377 RepID=A0A517DSI6_9FIRM|nr:hypothetical protein [Sporomusa termitida]QDR80297.1 Putative sensory transducer protein YfmS [Sporomusa termitida]